TSDQLSQQNDIFKPEFWIHARMDVLANFRVRKRPDRFFDDGRGEHDLERVLQKPHDDLSRRSLRSNERADVDVGIQDSAEHDYFLAPRGLRGGFRANRCASSARSDASRSV